MLAIYDPVLVALSIVIAIFGSFTALVLTSGYERRLDLGGYAGCLACYGGIILGGSIWSMHFVAMLALHLPVQVHYDLVITLISLALPVFVTGLAFTIVTANWFGRLSIPVGGLVVGLAIAGMHYLGMSAVRGCGVAHTTPGVVLATAIAIVAAWVALWFVFRRRTTVETLLGAVVLGLAIAGMHYTAMLSTSFAPLATQLEMAAAVMAQDTLAYLVGAAMITICTANILVISRATPAQTPSRALT
jgi:NO-binding membrane sensor protein with MHYT domain